MSDSSARVLNLRSPTGGPPLKDVEDFSLVLGGPLFQLLRKSHLEGDAMDLLHRRILASVLITWFPLLLLSLFSSTSNSVARLSFFQDIEVHARFLVALPVLIGAELLVHLRIRPMVRRFVEWGMVPQEEMALFQKAIRNAVKMRDSVYVEVALLVTVYTLGVLLWSGRRELGAGTWYSMPGSRWNLTVPGYWYVFLSLPMFQFILLRWYMMSRCSWSSTAIHSKGQAAGLKFDPSSSKRSFKRFFFQNVQEPEGRLQ